MTAPTDHDIARAALAWRAAQKQADAAWVHYQAVVTGWSHVEEMSVAAWQYDVADRRAVAARNELARLCDEAVHSQNAAGLACDGAA